MPEIGRLRREIKETRRHVACLACVYLREIIDANGLCKRHLGKCRMADDQPVGANTLASLLAIIQEQQAQIGQLIAARNAAAFPSMTVAELVEKYMRSVKFHALANSANETRRFRLHLLPFFGADQVAALTTERVDQYRDLRRNESGNGGEPTRPGTRNREVLVLSAALSWAAREKIIPAHPIRGAPMEPENNLRQTCPSVIEVGRICFAARSVRLKALVTTKYYSGLRVSELLSVRRDQVQWDEGLLVLQPKQTKGKKKGRVTIFPEQASKHVSQYLAERDASGVASQLLFCTDSGNRISRRNFLRDFQTVAARALVGGADGETLCLHDLRSGFVGRQIEINTPHEVIKEMIGHTTESAFRRYVRVQRRWLIEARERTELAELRKSSRRPPSRARSLRLDPVVRKATASC